LVIVGGEADLAAPLVALGAAGTWSVHADRGDKVKRIDLIAGTHPNFMKIAPIIDALDQPSGEKALSISLMLA
jgi:hypothetical protein